MKKNIILYLFVFTLLVGLYFLVSGNKAINEYRETNSKLMQKNTDLKDEIEKLGDSIFDLQSFDYRFDEDAQDYFYDSNIENVHQLVKDALIAQNLVKPKNPLIPYESIYGKQFNINQSKILNHRWLVANFTDGKQWGQIVVKYFIVEDQKLNSNWWSMFYFHKAESFFKRVACQVMPPKYLERIKPCAINFKSLLFSRQNEMKFIAY